MCCLHRSSESFALIQFGGRLTCWGRLYGGFWLFFSSRWIFLAGDPLLCGIMYLGMADVSTQYQNMRGLYHYPLSCHLVQVLFFFLVKKAQRKDLAAHGKAEAYSCAGFLNLPEEFSFSTLNTGISGMCCDLVIYGSASDRSASFCFP